jgi:putative sporulation protein YtaF
MEGAIFLITLFSILTLTIAVSLDSFGVGLTYGIRKLKIPLKSLIIISSCSALLLYFAMKFGELLFNLIPIQYGEKIGGYILIGIGMLALYQVFKPEKKESPIANETMVIRFEIKSLGIVIQILKRPMVADFDKSGIITGIEAIMLGIALSLDAIGAGIGAALLGFPAILTALSVAVMSSTFLVIGLLLGNRFSKSDILKKLTYFPGMLLIILGIFKI